MALDRACRFWTQGSLLEAFNQWSAVVEVLLLALSVSHAQGLGHAEQQPIRIACTRLATSMSPDVTVHE